MGPEPLHTGFPGVDHAEDQVVRLERFRSEHPGVLILLPAQTGSTLYRATWVDHSHADGDDGAVIEVTHQTLRWLLDRLEQHAGLP